MDHISRSARSDDTTSLKREGLKYVLLDLPEEDKAHAASIIDLESKSIRGFNHVFTAKLLCPHRYSEDFARDPEQYVMCVVSILKGLTTQQDMHEVLSRHSAMHCKEISGIPL
jgi:hypothetical protein